MPCAPRRDEAPADAVSPEDALRAQLYRLLAHFLSAPPRQGGLDLAAALGGDGGSEFGRAIAGLAEAAAGTSAAAAADAYHVLFIGLGRGELVPFGSYYLTGFLHEKPLARLRQDMARLGLAREPGVPEPEDHIASVLEIMAGLIDGSFGAPLPIEEQRRFFEAHVGNWASHFFHDLEASGVSTLYSALGSVGSTFLEIEERAFTLS